MLLFPIFIFLGTAHAVPTQMGHQGRVLDVDGLPAEGPHTLDFHLYDASEDGTMVWSELHDVDLINGYYSLVLGADELDNPLDDSLLRDNELHLELTVGDDVPLSPRQALNAVPYARLAASATSVNGGSVNASEISISGGLVIDSSGTWVGATPSVSFDDLTDVPEDVDTVLSEDEVDAFCADNGYALSADLSAVATSGSWSDLSDVPEDVDTVLSEDEVDAFCADNGYALSADLAALATSGSWSDLSDVPEDVDTVLSEDEVDAFCADNGYAMAADLYETATELTTMVESALVTVAADIDEVAAIAGSGNRTQYFTEDGTFAVPVGVTSLSVYVTGGGGGGSNGESTELDLGTHDHAVAEHNHDGGSHTHAIGDHTHEGGDSHTHLMRARYCAGYSSCGGCTGYRTDYTGAAIGGGGAGSGSTGAVDDGATGTRALTTDGSALTGASVSHRGGDGGAGGGVTALISVSAGDECVVGIGSGGGVDAAGTATTVNCTAGTSISCDGGATGASDGSSGLDGICTLTEANTLAQFKAAHLAPGGGGLGAKIAEATNGQSGSVTVRY